MNIMSEKDCADGRIERERSEIDEVIKGRVMLDSCWIITKKDTENSFSFVFSSSDYEEDSFEIALRVFKALTGVKCTGTLSVSKFASLEKFLAVGISKTDLELIYTKRIGKTMMSFM